MTDGSYAPEISVANFGPAAATIALESATTVSGAPQRTTLATIILAGGESKTVPLSNMPLSPGLTNGLRIHTDAAPGDVLSKLVSRGGSQLPAVEILDKDERGAFNGGGHPWDVEPGVTSTLLLFNGDSTPQKVNLRFGAASGPWMRRFTLEPMETRAIGINELVGMQEKDDSGLALPSSAQSGELGWQSDSTWVSGRLLQTSTALGMARSFSCSQWVYACAFTLSPTPSLTLYLNNTGNLSEIPDWAVYTGFHPPTTCSCANPTSGNTTLYDSWQSGNASIATITSGGTSSASVWQGVGVGSTTSYFYGNNMFLGWGSLMCQAEQPAVVSAPTRVAYVGENAHGAAGCPAGQAGFSRQVTLQIVDKFGKPAKIQNWTVSDIITAGSPNDLGVTHTQTGSLSNISGPWLDQYFVCSTACPQSTGSTDALQTWTGNATYPLGSNSIVYKCNGITFDGH